MKLNPVGPLDLKTSQKSSEVLIDGSGPLSIQPVAQNVCGTPTYTLEVSNDKDENIFFVYDGLLINVLFGKSLQIDYEKIPWKYMRISISSKVGDSGIVTFIFGL